MITGKPQHLETFDYVGVHAYFLTFCTFNRLPRFTTDARVQTTLTQIRRAASEQRFAIVAYCFMRDHVHLAVESTSEQSNCLTFIARAKQYSGFHFQRSHGERLWQRYGYQRTLRGSEAVLSVARYILENPVRAGIVREPLDYPFLGSDTHPVHQILEALQLAPRWLGNRG